MGRLTSTAPLTSPHLTWLWVSGKAPVVPTWLLKHQHGLRGRVDRQRARPLHRAVAPAGHAVTAPRVGKPQVLWGANTGMGCKAKPSVLWVYSHFGLVGSQDALGWKGPYR